MLKILLICKQHIKLCKNLEWEEFKQGECIIEEGHEPNGKFYLIFKGVVEIVKSSNQDYMKSSSCNFHNNSPYLAQVN